MKRIFYIAKNEIYTLFYSPIAWLTLILFLILTSVDYIDRMQELLGYYERGSWGLSVTNYLTSQIIANPLIGYFKKVMSNLYMFFPFITMGLISRERNNGTLTLLYSSPVKIRELVLGKFVAMLFFVLCLSAMIIITYIAMSMTVVNVDVGQMAGSLFGVFLILAAYSAIGLFLSSLTSYQIVAAISTFAVLFFFSRIGGLWQEIDIVREITYYMNLPAKSQNLLLGLLNLRDITYLLLITGTFLAFSIFRIKAVQESVSKFKTAMRYIVVVLVAAVVGYVTNKPTVNMYFDSSRGNSHTLSQASQAVLGKLHEDVLEVTIYANLFSHFFGNFAPSIQNMHINTMWEKYIRFKPDLKINFNYHYATDTGSAVYKSNPNKTLAEIAAFQAKTYKLDYKKLMPPNEVNRLVDTKSEGYRCFFQFKYKGQTEILRVYDDRVVMPSETEILAALSRFVDTPPKVLFLKDEIERDPFSDRTRDFQFITTQLGHRYALVNQGFDVDTLSLENSDIPSDIAALAIADPRKPFSATNLEKIQNFIAAGGNLYIAAEPDRKEIIRPILDNIGIQLKEGVLLQSSTTNSADYIHTYMTEEATKLSPILKNELNDVYKYTKDSIFRISMHGASILEWRDTNEFKVVPLLLTDADLNWNRTLPIDADSLNLKLPRMPEEKQGVFATSLRMTRQINNKQQSIMVFSDADYLTDPLAKGFFKPITYNALFGLHSFSYFANNRFPVYIERKESLDNAFKIKIADVPFQKMILCWVVPAIIGIMGAVILIRRKRK